MTSGTPVAPFAPPTDGAPPLRRGAPAWVAWVVTPLVAVLLSMSLDAVDLVAPDVLGGASARFLPPEGQRTVMVAADGVETVTEHTRSIGVEGAFAAPLTVTGALLERLGDETLRQAQWWRASRVSSSGERFTDLYRVSEAGIGQVASWGGPVGFVFEPELLVLPASVQPGDTWSDSGSALAGGVLTYSASSIARAATGPFTDAEGLEIPLTGGCIGVETTLRLESPADDFSTELIEAIVWCPGRGPVWSSGTLDGQPVGQAEVRPGALLAADAPPAEVASWPETVNATSALSSGRELELSIVDAFFGSSEASGQFWVSPASTSDGRLVTANDRGDDVQVWSLEGAVATLDWAGHPGGTIIAVGTVGDLVLATTSRRQVVAYDSTGRRLWNWPADELVLIAPQAADLGASGVVVVARSGTVTVLDPASGAVRWSRSIGADARAATAIPGGMVLVGDERERLTALDAATGEQVWRRDAGLIDVVEADPGMELVVVMTEAGEVIGLEIDDGAERFSTVYVGIAGAVAFGVDDVVVQSDERTIALGATDGSARWRSAGGFGLLGSGEVVAILQRESIALRATGDGTVVDERLLDSSSASSIAAVALGTVVVLVESDGALQSWVVE